MPTKNQVKQNYANYPFIHVLGILLELKRFFFFLILTSFHHIYRVPWKCAQATGKMLTLRKCRDNKRVKKANSVASLVQHWRTFLPPIQKTKRLGRCHENSEFNKKPPLFFYFIKTHCIHWSAGNKEGKRREQKRHIPASKGSTFLILSIAGTSVVLPKMRLQCISLAPLFLVYNN